MTLSVNKINNNNIYPNFQNNKKNNKVSAATKIAAGTGSLIGVASALAYIAKRRGINLNMPAKNLIDTFKKVEFTAQDVIGIASASTAGGFAGGFLTDRKNTKAKAKEGIVQLIGNYIVPSLFVSAGIALNKALNKKYNFPPITKPIQFAFGFVSLIGGVIFGNKISKGINSLVFKEENYRPLNWKDWAAQFDNLCLVTSMATTGTDLAKAASKAIPFAHLVPGYVVGTKTNNK